MSSDQNPYQVPQSQDMNSPSATYEQVHAVAKGQRLVNIGILFYLAMIPINVFLQITTARSDGAPSIVAALILIPLGLCFLGFLIYGVVRLASALEGTASAVAYCVALFIPCIGLILLLVLNSKATNYLKSHGVSVGLMGADPKTLPK